MEPSLTNMEPSVLGATDLIQQLYIYIYIYIYIIYNETHYKTTSVYKTT